MNHYEAMRLILAGLFIAPLVRDMPAHTSAAADRREPQIVKDALDLADLLIRTSNDNPVEDSEPTHD